PAGIDDGERGLGIAEEIVELGHGIGGVERQEDDARARRGQVEQDRLRALLDLDRPAVAPPEPALGQSTGVARRSLPQRAIGEDSTAGRLEEGLIGISAACEQAMEEMGGHGALLSQLEAAERINLRTAEAAVNLPSAANAS